MTEMQHKINVIWIVITVIVLSGGMGTTTHCWIHTHTKHINMYVYNNNNKIWPHWHRRELLCMMLQPQLCPHVLQYLCEGKRHRLVVQAIWAINEPQVYETDSAAWKIAAPWTYHICGSFIIIISLLQLLQQYREPQTQEGHHTITCIACMPYCSLPPRPSVVRFLGQCSVSPTHSSILVASPSCSSILGFPSGTLYPIPLVQYRGLYSNFLIPGYLDEEGGIMNHPGIILDGGI